MRGKLADEFKNFIMGYTSSYVKDHFYEMWKWLSDKAIREAIKNLQLMFLGGSTDDYRLFEVVVGIEEYSRL